MANTQTELRRQGFTDALAYELDEALATAYVNTDRLSWLESPETLDNLDRWRDMARGILEHLEKERARTIRGISSRGNRP